MRLLQKALLLLVALVLVACDTGFSDSDAKRGITGVLDVQVADFDDHAETTAVLVTDGGDRILLLIATDKGLTSGRRVEVRGTWAEVTGGYDGALDVEAITAASDSSDVRQATQTLRSVGHRKVAVLMLKNSGSTPERTRELIQELDRFFAENSNGLVTFEGQGFGPYDISDAAYASGAGAIAEEATRVWEAQGNNRNNYQHLAFVMDPTKYPELHRWGGLADVNGNKSYYRAFDIRIFSHEIGHNLGMLHSGSIDCGASIYKDFGQSCHTEGYGHKFDPMGGTFNGHFSSPQKQRVGWLEQCQDVTTTGGGIFELAPLEGECGVRSLRIPLPKEEGSFDAKQEFYYIGYREHGSGEYAGVSRTKDGVVVSVSEDALTGGATPALLDFTPESADSFWDAYLPVGEWYDLPHGVRIKVRHQNSTRAVVEVRTAGTGSPRCVDNTVPPIRSNGNYHGNIGSRCGDGSDLCPDDPNKTVPGVCGCGSPETDRDGDGTFDCIDSCPDDRKKSEDGVCGCGVEDDANRDGLFDCVTYDTCNSAENSDPDGDGVLNCSDFIDESDLSRPPGQELHFTLEVPAGSSRAAITLVPGTGDPDLYVRRGQRPDLDHYDCRPWQVGPTREVCLLENPEPGTYHIMVKGYQQYGFGRTTLLANYSGNPLDGCPTDASKVVPGTCGCGIPEQSGCGGGGATANGLVVLEAEDFDSRLSRGGSYWQPISPNNLSGKKGMRAWPNSGTRVSSNYKTTSPQLDYSVNFAHAGRYYVWVRAQGESGNDDSLHVGLDGTAPASGFQVDGSIGALGWKGSLMGGGRAYVDVGSAGAHVFNVWMREDGLTLDKIILTTDPNFNPDLASVRLEWKELDRWAQAREENDQTRTDEDKVCGDPGATNVRGVPTSNTGGWTRWEFVEAGGPWYHIRSSAFGKYLQATSYNTTIDNDTDDVVRLVDSKCNGAWTQWKLVPTTTPGYYRLENRAHGTWLQGKPDEDPESGAENYLTVTKTSNNGESTLWKLVDAP